jgi:prenyltransferase beta subunit
MFALMGLAALEEGLPPGTSAYIEGFDASGLDLVHLCCLARCRNLSGILSSGAGAALAEYAEGFRASDGGFGLRPGAKRGCCYGTFLAAGLYEDIGIELPETASAAASLRSLAAPDGSFVNEATLPFGSATATAAAVTTLARLDERVPGNSIPWLQSCAAPAGGFSLAPGLAGADLLSSACALLALAEAGTVMGTEQARLCREYILSLRSLEGGFADLPGPGRADCEYTFYGLLSLGLLDGL